MRLKLEKQGLCIIPESPQDEAYIEHTLGVTEVGAEYTFKAEKVVGTSSLAYLEIPRGTKKIK